MNRSSIYTPKSYKFFAQFDVKHWLHSHKHHIYCHIFHHSHQTESSWWVSKEAVKTNRNESHQHMCHTHCKRTALQTGDLKISMANDQYRTTHLSCNTTKALSSRVKMCMHCVCACLCVCGLTFVSQHLQCFNPHGSHFHIWNKNASCSASWASEGH